MTIDQCELETFAQGIAELVRTAMQRGFLTVSQGVNVCRNVCRSVSANGLKRELAAKFRLMGVCNGVSSKYESLLLLLTSYGDST